MELMNWTTEEGERLPHAMFGSIVVTGEASLGTPLNLTEYGGIPLDDEIERIGYAHSHRAVNGVAHNGLSSPSGQIAASERRYSRTPSSALQTGKQNLSTLDL